MDKEKKLLSVLLGVLVSFTDKYGVMILLVGCAIVFDFATGIVKAKINENLSSEIGTKGLFKKVALLICLFFGFFLDYALVYMGNYISINIPITPFGMILCFYIILNESISICENLYACDSGIMPQWIVKILQSAKSELEDNKDGKIKQKK